MQQPDSAPSSITDLDNAAPLQQQQQQQPSAEKPLAQFQVTKLRSWRTGYIRLLVLYEKEFGTLDPTSSNETTGRLQETNRWPYSAIFDFLAIPKETDTILLQVNNDKLKFSCHGIARSAVLTALLAQQEKSGQLANPQSFPLFTGQRWKRDGSQSPVLLQVLPYGLAELDKNSRQRLQVYQYTALRAVSFPPSEETALFLHFHQPHKVRLYNVDNRTALFKAMQQHAGVLGLDPLPMEPSSTIADWLERRRYVPIGSVAMQFDVTKTSRRHDSHVIAGPTKTPGGVVSRQLCLTGNQYLVECDHFGVVNVHKLQEIIAVVRPYEPQNAIIMEYADGSVRTYHVRQHRDALVVSILDAAVQLGRNHTIHVSDVQSAGYYLASDHEKGSSGIFQPTPIPQYALKRVHSLATHTFALVSGEFGSTQQSERHQQEQKLFCANLASSDACLALVETCREFNASVQIENPHVLAKLEKQIVGSMGALFGLLTKLLAVDSDTQTNSRNRHINERTASTLFQTLHRLARTPTGYRCSADLTTLRECLPFFWNIEDTFCRFNAFSVLNSLLSGTNKDDSTAKRDMEAEYVNKNVLLQTGGPALIDGLVSSLLPCDDDVADASKMPISDLILMVTSDILQSLLCSYHDTTSPEHFQAFIVALANRYRALLSTLRSPTPFVIENTALLLHLLSTHAPSSAAAIRDAALSSAILLQHFYLATFSPLEGQRFLSRFLCGLWFSGPASCEEKRLLKRMVPHGFLAYLNMPILSRMEEEQLDELERDAVEGNITDQGAAAEAALAAQDAENPISMLRQQGATSTAGGTNTARLRARVAIAASTAANTEISTSRENFRVFFHVLTKDSSLPDLIWSQQTRRELRIALESELEYIRREIDARGANAIAWNYQQFSVKYPSLHNEVKVGDVYMRLWLQAGDGFIRSWEEPVRLFEHLFRRFLCEVDRDVNVTVMCVRCLERLYAIHAAKIGPFTDVMILVRSMASTRSVETQHRLLGLLATVLGVSEEGRDERYSVAEIPENAEQLLNVESISQLCQFVAWGHTSREHVANMLARSLSTGMKTKMLTNGTDAKPSEGGSAGSRVAEDSCCPPVWFVASTGRIPPPSESIQGPFRVTDLLKMMECGELSPYDLVTASHVEEYDLESEADAIQEAHIDTGKWERLNEVWQLRWQLCTDVATGAIYTPSEVSQLALKALTRLVDLHRSLDSRGVPYVPIPIAKRILCGSSRDPSFSSESKDLVAYPLPILCQALLCNDSKIVEQAAFLISKLCQHNERAVAKLYLTGIFYFIFCYTGSNFKALSRLLGSTHLRQHFRSGFAAAANESELPMKERSILGNMLPEGMLFILSNYGADRFADVFVGNADTPEVIWTFEMRKHLIEMVQQHLGDFPFRLFQNSTTEYEYCPIPGVAYKRLENEIFCHNYYLHNLCDEVRFPEWPISEPVEVFRACLQYFKKQTGRDECSEEIAFEKARAVLQLNVGDGSKELRKAYRSLARKFHPDKNPSGRETFEAIQTSYEALLPLVERGEKIRVYADESKILEKGDDSTPVSAEGYFPTGKSQKETMHLLIKTQILICRRYENDMVNLKYPAYPVLLGCLRFSSTFDEQSFRENEFVKSERADFIRSTVELIFRTCLISPLNSEELVRESGVQTLASLLNFYIGVAGQMRASLISVDERVAEQLSSDEVIADIISHTIHTLSGIAFYDAGREAIKTLPDLSQLLLNWTRCLDGSLFVSNDGQALDGPMSRFALEGVANVAKDSKLQQTLVGCGIVWPLLRYSLQYDPTLDQPPANGFVDEDDVAVSVASTNIAARLSIRALGVLSGFYGGAPSNEPLAASLKILLTEPLARMLRNKRTGTMLSVLNSNVERADVIWNTRMRDQLDSLLLKLEKERPDGACRAMDTELQAIGDFQYESLQNEVRIGGVYVRIFNKDGKEALANVEDPNIFFQAVVNFVARSLNEATPTEDWINIPLLDDVEEQASGTLLSSSAEGSEFLLAINALRILSQVEGLIDDMLMHPVGFVSSVLLSLLELPADSEAFTVGTDILHSLSSKQVFADAVTKEGSFWRLLQLLERPEINEEMSDENTQNFSSATKVRAWSILESLSSSPSIAQCILASSGWIELLGVMVGYAGFTKLWTARRGASKTLSRLLWDPKTGVRAESLLKRFIPAALIVHLKEDPEEMVKKFDATSDTPELIWDASMRSELREALGTQIERILHERKEEPGDLKHFSLGPEVFVRYAALDDELYIGGVYVSRFLKEPTYNLRDPTAFLELLLQRWSKEIELYTTKTQTARAGDSDAITTAGQDTLELVTTACVYLCRVTDSLCDKLAIWGYMARAVQYLDSLLESSITGTPLLAVVRLLHVSSGRMANVEALSLVGHSDGRRGVVEFTMRAIGDETLHKDSAFMIEFLKKLYQVALGNLKSSQAQATFPPPSAIAMAPSPAPGEAPVRKRVNIGDDPLGMLQGSVQPQPAQQQGNIPMHQQPAPVQSPPRNGSSVVGHNQGPMQYMQTPQTQPYQQHTQPQQNQLHQDHSYQQRPREQQAQSYQQRSQQHEAQSFQQHSQQQQALSFQQRFQQQQAQSYQQRSQQEQVQSYQQLSHQQQVPQQQPQPQLQQHHQLDQRSSQQQQASTFQQRFQQQEKQSAQPHSSQQQNQSFPQRSQQQQPPLSYQQRSQQQDLSQQQPIPSSYRQMSPQQHLSYQSSQQQQQQPAYQKSQFHGTDFLQRQQEQQPVSFQQGLQRQQRRQQQQHPASSQPPLLHQQPSAHQQSPSQYGAGLVIQTSSPSMPTQTSNLGFTSGQNGSLPFSPPQQSPDIIAPQYHPQDNYPHQFGQDETQSMQQPGPASTNDTPIVETVTDEPVPVPQYGPAPIEGSGIDARSSVDPKVVADQQAAVVTGAPGAAQGRVALLQQALACKLCEFMVETVLENTSLQKIRDPAAAKVHAIDLLKVLTKDPGFGPKFKILLDDLPSWKKYRSQDHSLLITGHEQRADYFLTDGGSEKETKLLTNDSSENKE